MTYRLITCQKVSQLPGEQMMHAELWKTASQTHCHQPMGSIICGPQEKGQIQYFFMCVTMINPATSWFKLVELLVSEQHLPDISTDTKRQKGTITD